MRRVKVTALDNVLLLLCLLFAVGVKLLFPACGLHEDGSWGTCHWAEQAVFALAIALCAQALIMLFAYSRRMKIGAAAAMIPTAAAAAALPGFLIDLCADSTMACNTLFRLCVWGLSAAIALLALIHAIAQYRHVMRREHG